VPAEQLVDTVPAQRVCTPPLVDIGLGWNVLVAQAVQTIPEVADAAAEK